MVSQDRVFWKDWVRFLDRWGLKQAASVMLDAASPVGIIAAQFIHASQPFFARPGGQWEALANLLEDQEASRSFAAYLQQEDNH